LHVQESLSTLTFAQNAKMIENKAIINEEITNEVTYKEELIKLKEKYNKMVNDNRYLYNMIENGKKDPTLLKANAEFNLKSFDLVEEDLNQMKETLKLKEDEINILQKEMSYIKTKNMQFEIVIKGKEKELQDLKMQLNTSNQENHLNLSKLNEFVYKNACSTNRIMDIEKTLNQKQFILTNEIERLKANMEQNQIVIEKKEKTIKSLYDDINKYMSLISEKEKKIFELKNEIDEYKISMDLIRSENERITEEKNRLLHELDDEKSNLTSKVEKIRMQDEKLEEIRNKGRSMINQYEDKINRLRLKMKETDEDYKKFNMERKNLHILINELKNEKNIIEEKYAKQIEDYKRMLIERDGFKEEIYKHKDEIGSLKAELSKTLEENNIFMQNK
jgi:chromosome segregation ATPase